VAQGDLRPLLAKVPDAAVAVATVADPSVVARSLTELLAPVPVGLPADLVTRLGVGLTALRVALDGSTAAWLQRMAGGGLVVAVLPPAVGVDWQWLLLTRPTDVAAADAWCAAHGERLHRTVLGDLLVLGPNAAVVEQVRAREATVSGRWSASDAVPAAAITPGIAARIDLTALRSWLGPRAPMLERLGGAARFVFAPIVHALTAASWLQLDLRADASRLHIGVQADASLLSVPYSALLANGAGSTARPTLPADGLLSLTLDRSLRALLDEPGRFLAADDVQSVQGFLSIADALDGPRSSFVTDLLGGLREPITLQVLPRAAVDDESELPPLQLPEFVVSVVVADERAIDVMFRTARVLATIVNAERAQRGEAPFLMRRLQDGNGHGLVAEPPPWRGPGRAPVDRQLSPTLWVGGGRVALASTVRAAQAAVVRPLAPAAVTGDAVVLRGPAIAAAIAGSRSALALGRMLDEGEDRAEAQRFFAALIAVTETIAELRLGVVLEAATTQFELELERRR
jgi:hypothetical protein